MARDRVCLVRHDYYPDGHVSRDAEALARAGYRVCVVTLRRPGEPAREELNGVAIYRQPVGHRRGGLLRYLWEYAAFLVLAFWTVTRLHLRDRFAVVEVDNMPDILVFSALVPKLTGARVFLYIFDNMPELYMTAKGVGPGHPAVRLLALLERASAAFADRVVVTQEMARHAVAARAVRAEKIAVVLNCPDETIFRPIPPRKSDAERGPFEIVTHGTVIERYGIQVLLDALPQLAAAIPQVRVHIFGQGEYRAALEAQAARNGVAGLVCFHGYAPIDDLLAHIQRADVGYVGMLCDLMLSNKLMEYVTLGVPAVVARWPTYEHYFPEGSVTYYRPGDADDLAAAILRVYNDPEGTRLMAERAAALNRGYAWPVQRQIYLDLYARAIAS